MPLRRINENRGERNGQTNRMLPEQQHRQSGGKLEYRVMADQAAPVAISRLKRRRDFLRVAAERKKWVTPGLILQAAPLVEGRPPRRGKKNAGAAAPSSSPASSSPASSSPASSSSASSSPAVPAADAAPQGSPVPVPEPGMAAGTAGEAIAEMESAGKVRVGFTVSKKVGNAVARNRARRRLKAAVDQVLAGHGVAGTDYVLVGRIESIDRPFQELLRDLRVALKRVQTVAKSAPRPPGGKGRSAGGKPAAAKGTGPKAAGPKAASGKPDCGRNRAGKAGPDKSRPENNGPENNGPDGASS